MLVDGEPVQTDDHLEWAAWMTSTMENDGRRVEKTDVGDVMVSTVFLGIDHQDGSSGPPLLYETMVFGHERLDICERYATRAQAIDGHAQVVRAVRAALGLTV
jgi:hypothetical protein